MMEVTYRPYVGATKGGHHIYGSECTKLVDFVEYAKLMYEGKGHILHTAWVDHVEEGPMPLLSVQSPPKELLEYTKRWSGVLESLYDVLYQVPDENLDTFFGFHHPISLRQLKSIGTTKVDLQRLVLFLCEYGFITSTSVLQSDVAKPKELDSLNEDR